MEASMIYVQIGYLNSNDVPVEVPAHYPIYVRFDVRFHNQIGDKDVIEVVADHLKKGEMLPKDMTITWGYSDQILQ